MNQLMQSTVLQASSHHTVVEMAGVIIGSGFKNHGDGRMPHIGRRERRRNRSNRH